MSKAKWFLVLSGFLVSSLVLSSCAPAPLSMKNGEALNTEIKSGKLTVAVLPTVDYSSSPSLCQGYWLGGCYGALSNGLAYDSGGVRFTNEITEALWKQNVCYIAKPDSIIAAAEKVHVNKSEVFPAPQSAFLGCLTGLSSPINSPTNVGNHMAPDYSRLYDLGKAAGADIVLISRLSTNMKASVCTYSGGELAGISPYLIAIPLAQGIYNSFISPTDEQQVQLDLIALDVRNRKVISFGDFGAAGWANAKERKVDIEKYGNAMVFYFNLPSDETRKKEALASAASFASTMIANQVIQALTGLQIGVSFNFTYQSQDVTWEQYGPGYFQNHYAWTNQEYDEVFSH